jgi:hypothetical protein
VLRVEDQDAEEDELRDDELDPEKALVAVGAVEDLLRDAGDVDVGEGEVPRYDAVPQRPGGRRPDACENERRECPQRRAAAQANASSAGSGSGSTGGRRAGLAYG